MSQLGRTFMSTPTTTRRGLVRADAHILRKTGMTIQILILLSLWSTTAAKRRDRREAQILQEGTLVIGRRVASRQVEEQRTGESGRCSKNSARDERVQEQQGRSAASQ